MRFYRTIDNLISAPPSYSNPFITQYETIDSRMYIVWDGISEYKGKLFDGKYDSCHEVFLSSSYDKEDDVYGHIAFDMDIHDMGVKDWVKDFELDILDVLNSQYPNVKNLSLGKSVWMTSPSVGKISKHVVFHGIIFASWRIQSKLLISGLKEAKSLRSEKSIIESIDDGITRKLGSLRMPLNTKASKKNHIFFDNPSDSFEDGLVLIYKETISTIIGAQTLEISDMKESLYIESTYKMPEFSHIDHVSHDIDIADDVISRCVERMNNTFGAGLALTSATPNQNGIIPLKRLYPGKCPISSKIHDKDGGYVICTNGRVLFGCNRGCKLEIAGKTPTKVIDIYAVDRDMDKISIKGELNAVQIMKTLKNS